VARALLVAGFVLLALTATASAGESKVLPCTGGQLTGVFTVVNGSAGAGNISYDLRLRNRSKTTCSVLGAPPLRLLGRTGKPLPTNVIPDSPLSARVVVLKPGAYAAATARFTPDVPGPGEPVNKQCEPTAYKVRVTTYTGSVTLPVTPPTPVCVHGRISLTPLVAGKHGPRS
jgi:hypothetical protein